MFFHLIGINISIKVFLTKRKNLIYLPLFFFFKFSFLFLSFFYVPGWRDCFSKMFHVFVDRHSDSRLDAVIRRTVQLR